MGDVEQRAAIATDSTCSRVTLNSPAVYLPPRGVGCQCGYTARKHTRARARRGVVGVAPRLSFSWGDLGGIPNDYLKLQDKNQMFTDDYQMFTDDYLMMAAGRPWRTTTQRLSRQPLPPLPQPAQPCPTTLPHHVMLPPLAWRVSRRVADPSRALPIPRAVCLVESAQTGGSSHSSWVVLPIHPGGLCYVCYSNLSLSTFPAAAPDHSDPCSFCNLGPDGLCVCLAVLFIDRSDARSSAAGRRLVHRSHLPRRQHPRCGITLGSTNLGSTTLGGTTLGSTNLGDTTRGAAPPSVAPPSAAPPSAAPPSATPPSARHHP